VTLLAASTLDHVGQVVAVVATSFATIAVAFTLIDRLTRVNFRFGKLDLSVGPRLEDAVEEIRKETGPAALAKGDGREFVLLREYHAQGLGQAKISFRLSMVFATLGFTMIIFAVVADSVGFYKGSTSVPLIAGAIVEAVGGLFFVQSNRAQNQMLHFFDRLRLDRRLEEALKIADTIPDGTLESRLKVMLALELSGGKPSDQQIAALVAPPETTVVPLVAPRD
jgi:Cyanobacterial TRADD-N associated 2-Transmembrane domain